VAVTRTPLDPKPSGRFQGQGAGREAAGLLAQFPFGQRGHHRITIDPAAANEQAIRSYAAAGFRPAGVMRQYERGGDGHFHDGLLMDLLRRRTGRKLARAARAPALLLPPAAIARAPQTGRPGPGPQDQVFGWASRLSRSPALDNDARR
jgi:hypothetical protein